ncbi:MAG TPA: nuclear transport factor 2 family protein [Steroidobacteraceae bacterium]|nr:nuclear transport factor 2 family protein [Steroidobacteraceae bacterium]
MSNETVELADRLSITDLIYRYCRAMDRIDQELGYGIWHEDGEADYGPIFRGRGRAFVDWVCEQHRPMVAHAHQVSNTLIELDGHRAASESYVNIVLRYRADGRLMEVTVRGRYLDRWSRRNGKWGLDKRMFVQDFDEVREVAEINLEGWGRRDKNDPSYAVLSHGS